MNPDQQMVAELTGIPQKLHMTVMEKVGNGVYIYAYDDSLLTRKSLG